MTETHQPELGAPDDLDRRRFFHKVAATCAAILAGTMVVPAVTFLLGLRKVPRRWQVVGKVEEFPVGQTVEVAVEDPSPLPWAGVTAKTAAWLRRESEANFVAFSINCTHLGCPVRWLPEAELFLCPCHGGVYYRDGTVAAGPPPKPLARYPVRVQDGNVEILTTALPISGE